MKTEGGKNLGSFDDPKNHWNWSNAHTFVVWKSLEKEGTHGWQRCEMILDPLWIHINLGFGNQIKSVMAPRRDCRRGYR
jgi:hypothetical protein